MGTGVVLGITSRTSRRAAGVPTAVYATVVCLQSLGLIFAMFLGKPSEIRRKNGKPIAHFKLLTWREELLNLPKTLARPETLLLAVPLFVMGVPFSFLGALNGSFFSARTRALCNVRSSLLRA